MRNALPRSPVHNPAHENIEFQDTLKPVARLSVPAGSYLASAYFSLRNDYDSAVHQVTCRLAADYPPGEAPMDQFALFNLPVPRQAPYSMPSPLRSPAPSSRHAMQSPAGRHG
ncbi:hypothetical protein ACWEPL_63780 [Nonomuraea sp. NPDC004186]